MKTVIIMGSTSDEHHAKKITDKLDTYGIQWEQHAASAHKEPRKVLDILDSNKNEKDLVYITIAGRSNALSALYAAPSHPPAKSIGIHSIFWIPLQNLRIDKFWRHTPQNPEGFIGVMHGRIGVSPHLLAYMAVTAVISPMHIQITIFLIIL